MIGKTVSHYKILEKLGEGGMGVVYKAQDLKLPRFVALKFLPPHLSASPDAKKRFIHEAEAASSLEHSNVCAIHEIDASPDGRTFIVMPCYEGESLQETIKRGPMSVDEVITIAIQVAAGLASAHEKDIIHRDVKPANVFVTKDGTPKVLDFGLAVLGGQTRLTRPGTAVGTVAYMSPEQAQGHGGDRRSDIWSLGVMLYEMLSGTVPFAGDHEQAVIYSIIHLDPEPVTRLRPGVPVELERIVARAMSKSVRDRYQHVNDLLTDLRRLSDDVASGTARQVPLHRRFLRRKPAPLVAALLVVAIAAVVARYVFFLGNVAAIESIAVLPLEDLSGDPGQDYFVDGMTGALITELGQVRTLRVISRTSVMQYRDATKPVSQIAEELGVDAVVEGTVERSGDRVRITAHLIRADPERQLFARTYDRNLRDVLALHSEVAQSITEEIKLSLTPQEMARLASSYPVDPDAHDAYLKGRHQYEKWAYPSNGVAIEYFEKAIEIDSSYALAYAGLAAAHAWIVGETADWKDSTPKAIAAATSALELDESLAEAHAALAMVKFHTEWDWEGAEREFKRAIELGPNDVDAHHWYAHYLMAMGRVEEALRVSRRAVDLDPLSPAMNLQLGWELYYARMYPQAIEQFNKTLGMDPNYLSAYGGISWPYLLSGMEDEGVTAWQHVMALQGASEEEVAALRKAYEDGGVKGFFRWRLEWTRKMSGSTHAPAYAELISYVGMGETEKAFEWLQKAYEEHEPKLRELKASPFLEPLRSDPRYFEMLEKLGLDE
ncbi:MAG: protein kinase [Candidatus Krumholzibacteriia bacterium]